MEKDQKKRKTKEKHPKDSVPSSSLNKIRTFTNDKKALKSKKGTSVVGGKVEEIDENQMEKKEEKVEEMKLKKKEVKLEQSWKNFSSKREMWFKKGIKANDVRDFQTEYSKKNVLKKFLLYSSIIFFLVGGFFITSSYLFYTKIVVEEQKIEEKVLARFGAEKTISVNISENIEPLRKVISAEQKLDLLTEIVPYRIINEQPEGVDIIDLFKLFNTNIPTALLSSLSGQSFIGTLPTKKENGFILVFYT